VKGRKKVENKKKKKNRRENNLHHILSRSLEAWGKRKRKEKRTELAGADRLFNVL